MAKQYESPVEWRTALPVFCADFVRQCCGKSGRIFVITLLKKFMYYLEVSGW